MTTRSGKQFQNTLQEEKDKNKDKNNIQSFWGKTPCTYSQNKFLEIDQAYDGLLTRIKYYRLHSSDTCRHPFISTDAFKNQRRAKLLFDFFRLYTMAAQLPGIVRMDKDCGTVYVQAFLQCTQIIKVACDLKSTYLYPELDKVVADFNGILKKMPRIPDFS